MKAKNVRSVCKAKMREFLSHVEDEDVRKTISENAIITGGAIASMLLGEKVHDFDVYFRTKDATASVARYFVKKFKENPPPRFTASMGKDKVAIYVSVLDDRVSTIVQSAGVASESSVDAEYKYFESQDPESGDAAEYLETVAAVLNDAETANKSKKEKKKRYRPVFLSRNAITLSDKVQLITRFFGSPEQIHVNYDFVHCMNYWTSWDNNLVLRPDAVEALLARELRYVGSKYPLCSVIRTRKFIQRGWSVTAGQYLKMAMQLSDLDLHDIDVLEEQLTGVDAAYFHEVIDALKDRDAKRVDAAYLVELIDRIF